MEPELQQQIQQMILDSQSAYNFHAHTGNDSQPILPNNLLPFQFLTDLTRNGGDGKLLAYNLGNDFGLALRFNQVWVLKSFYQSEVDVYNNAVQSFADSTDTVVQFNTKIYDTSTEFSTSTHAFTAKTAGKYMLSSMLTLNGNGQAELNVKVNGTIQATSIKQLAGLESCSISENVRLAVGDVLTITMKQTTGININSSAGRTLNYLNLIRIS